MAKARNNSSCVLVDLFFLSRQADNGTLLSAPLLEVVSLLSLMKSLHSKAKYFIVFVLASMDFILIVYTLCLL